MAETISTTFTTKHSSLLKEIKRLSSELSKEKVDQLYAFTMEIFAHLPFQWTIDFLKIHDVYTQIVASQIDKTEILSKEYFIYLLTHQETSERDQEFISENLGKTFSYLSAIKTHFEENIKQLKNCTKCLLSNPRIKPSIENSFNVLESLSRCLTDLQRRVENAKENLPNLENLLNLLVEIKNFFSSIESHFESARQDQTTMTLLEPFKLLCKEYQKSGSKNIQQYFLEITEYIFETYKIIITLTLKNLSEFSKFSIEENSPIDGCIKNVLTLFNQLDLSLKGLRDRVKNSSTDLFNPLEEFKTFLTDLEDDFEKLKKELATTVESNFIERQLLPDWEKNLFDKMFKHPIFVKHFGKDIFYPYTREAPSFSQIKSQKAVDNYIKKGIDLLYKLLPLRIDVSESEKGSIDFPLMKEDLNDFFKTAFKETEDKEMKTLLSIMHLWIIRQFEWIQKIETFRFLVDSDLKDRDLKTSALKKLTERFVTEICIQATADLKVAKNGILVTFPKKVKEKGSKFYEEVDHFYAFDQKAYTDRASFPNPIFLQNWNLLRKQEILLNTRIEQNTRIKGFLNSMNENESPSYLNFLLKTLIGYLITTYYLGNPLPYLSNLFSDTSFNWEGSAENGTHFSNEPLF